MREATFHPDGLGVRNVRLTRHILTVSTACHISETKIVCQQIRYRFALTETRSSILDTTEPINQPGGLAPPTTLLADAERVARMNVASPSHSGHGY
jgi:hypothetical protein